MEFHDWLSPREVALETRAAVALEKLGLSLAALQTAAAQVDPEPTAAQKESGNYKKGHVVWKTLPITIETAKGQYRRGVGKDGKPWKTLMQAHYGYIKRTHSEADGDHIDVFLGGDFFDRDRRRNADAGGQDDEPGDANRAGDAPGEADTGVAERSRPDDHPENQRGKGSAAEQNLQSELVFVINQVDPGTQRWDEHKAVLGTVSEEAARALYLSCYQDGWQGLGSMVALTLNQFKDWIKHGDTSKPLKEQRWFKSAAVEPKSAFEKEARKKKDVAIDLDGTLAETMRPFDPKTIGQPRDKARKLLDTCRKYGATIIINTVRGDTKLVAEWLKEHELPYDHIGENPRQPPNSSHKIYAHAYVDDRGINAKDLDEAIRLLVKLLTED